MDTKDIIIICEAVLLAVLLIVLVAVIVRGNGQGFFSRRKPTGNQWETIAKRIENSKAFVEKEQSERNAKIAEGKEKARLAEKDADLLRILNNQSVTAGWQGQRIIDTNRTREPSHTGPGFGNYLFNKWTGGPTQPSWFAR